MEKDKKVKEEYASKEEIKSLNDKFEKLLEILTPSKSAIPSKEEVVIEMQPVPEKFTNPKWIQAVEEVLGKKVGVNVIYSDNGPIKIQLNIPKEISNASSDLWSYYKCDIRTIVLNSGEGLDKIKLGCQKIAKNLGLDSRDIRNQLNR